ncbi:SRPBCC family protein [Maricaulis sp.]|uniref:SRPBCC family protein n=1 Tax=Maricaulis sp. TaxID=1486257 RepID=UPI002632406F|nr:SRPBCC family protein [Maricaulis sp.]
MMSATRTAIEPLVKTIEVDTDAATAFAFFTDRIDSWWPAETHSMAADRGETRPDRIVFELKPGGRLYERGADGRECDWGRVRVYEPGKRVVFSWHLQRPADEATEVEVRFEALSDVTTRVVLVHRGWENWANGAEMRLRYDGGWDLVLAPFTRAIAA